MAWLKTILYRLTQGLWGNFWRRNCSKNVDDRARTTSKVIGTVGLSQANFSPIISPYNTPSPRICNYVTVRHCCTKLYRLEYICLQQGFANHPNILGNQWWAITLVIILQKIGHKWKTIKSNLCADWRAISKLRDQAASNFSIIAYS